MLNADLTQHTRDDDLDVLVVDLDALAAINVLNFAGEVLLHRLPRFFSLNSSTVPSISAITAGSFGLRASKISVTRGRPPVMSCVPEASRGVLATSVPAETVCPSLTSI